MIFVPLLVTASFGSGTVFIPLLGVLKGRIIDRPCTYFYLSYNTDMAVKKPTPIPRYLFNLIPRTPYPGRNYNWEAAKVARRMREYLERQKSSR